MVKPPPSSPFPTLGVDHLPSHGLWRVTIHDTDAWLQLIACDVSQDGTREYTAQVFHENSWITPNAYCVSAGNFSNKWRSLIRMIGFGVDGRGRLVTHHPAYKSGESVSEGVSLQHVCAAFNPPIILSRKPPRPLVDATGALVDGPFVGKARGSLSGQVGDKTPQRDGKENISVNTDEKERYRRGGTAIRRLVKAYKGPVPQVSPLPPSRAPVNDQETKSEVDSTNGDLDSKESDSREKPEEVGAENEDGEGKVKKRGRNADIELDTGKPGEKSTRKRQREEREQQTHTQNGKTRLTFDDSLSARLESFIAAEVSREAGKLKTENARLKQEIARWEKREAELKRREQAVKEKEGARGEGEGGQSGGDGENLRKKLQPLLLAPGGLKALGEKQLEIARLLESHLKEVFPEYADGEGLPL